MDHDKKSNRPPLLPDHHVTSDFFVCDIFDAIPKADMASMEHPVFSLSSKPDRRIRKYQSADGSRFLEVRPSAEGLATVHDRDILIFCISQIMAALNNGKQVSKVVRFKAYDYFVATNRQLGGSSYARLKASLERLRGTTISTNIVTGGIEQTEIFGLIDRVSLRKAAPCTWEAARSRHLR
jgi:plasmid replication initiation protein